MTETPRTMKELSERLETVRVVTGMSRQRFCRTLGIDPGYWTRLMSGDRTIGKEAIQKIKRQYPDLVTDALECLARGRGEYERQRKTA